VIVEGDVLLKKQPMDVEQLATEFEQRVTARDSHIGPHEIDMRSVSLGGFVSKNYVERVHGQFGSTGTSGYVIGGGIALGVIAVLLVAFAVIALNNKRSNGTLRFKEDQLASVETGRGGYGVNLYEMRSTANDSHSNSAFQADTYRSNMQVTNLAVNDDTTKTSSNSMR